MPSELLRHILDTHPAVIDAAAWTYLIGFLVAHALRAGWPGEAERPRAVRIILALVDACQLVFNAPVKALARKVQHGNAQ